MSVPEIPRTWVSFDYENRGLYGFQLGFVFIYEYHKGIQTVELPLILAVRFHSGQRPCLLVNPLGPVAHSSNSYKLQSFKMAMVIQVNPDSQAPAGSLTMPYFPLDTHLSAPVLL